MTVLYCADDSSAQAEKGEDEHYDYDQTNEINQTIHSCLRSNNIGLAHFARSRIEKTSQQRESSE
jgi:hypothetical protein